jgi:transcriptional regulator of acetoin/glycerol metabolism
MAGQARAMLSAVSGSLRTRLSKELIRYLLAEGQCMNRLSDPRLGMSMLEDQAAMIERSRRRSEAFGLQMNARPDLSRSAGTDLSLLLEQNRTLSTYALPVMDSLYDQIVNTRSMVVLTDADGLVLHSRGGDDFLQTAEKVAMRPGVRT